ncbi:hypothetical protein IMG5_167070 [Ichthyophthirius multifiliis]|uniref:Uncharacterized protein n=1 Tax=Ichthyophthirius multifiliis TaxID=5932 RepID=G0R0V3_ICHMU|nr:hypothetical protein IMG5_167070 [Ichthyophthirius multifiliis]EGR28913.1 hypothetical protein IMG5_167070 [Ichthyophthirius multifiliis]|eukprot:XP_004030149.1 hypothetical protein IMG5_167070 [Ichthyophthirius multifiliis]
MAIQYPFELDVFQKRAVLRLEEDESVFVCAHTSAGKTVIAEYAIALAQKKNRKAIYTSPIKALSNQKYRDFKSKFGDDVGIVTGDVSLNPTANCLIVTTEVLRNMLYKGHDIIRDISWVIFDEVHYVNNQERGVVWEETIIMLPESIGLVMLSATAPNYMDFANWVGRTKKRTIYVQKTLYRPVPLQHSIYIFEQFHVIKEKDEKFSIQEYDNLKNQIKKAQNLKNSINLNRQQNQSELEAIRKLLYICENQNLLPCVVFVFSKNKILELSEGLGNITFCTIEEQVKIKQKNIMFIQQNIKKRFIEKTFNQAAMKINFRDIRVPQIQKTKDLLTRGIAVHHGDVIPFIKEIVEILFSKGLIKVLFATETFAMGINMPTKTVIFHSTSKHDGFNLRMLNSSEYTQMSGRAGRRSLDDKGTVIIFIQDLNKLPTRIDLEKMLDHKYIDKDYSKPLLKARVAKEIQNIYVTEVLVSGAFDYLDEYELTALLSVFVCQGKAKGQKYDPEDDYETGLTYCPEFIRAYKQAMEITLSTVEQEIFFGIIVTNSAEQYLKDNIFNQDLVKVVYSWMHGADLLHVCQFTTYQEGSIVRCFLRLENLLNNVKSAAIILGDNHLAMKVDSSRELLVKDIVFQQSLYYANF